MNGHSSVKKPTAPDDDSWKENLWFSLTWTSVLACVMCLQSTHTWLCNWHAGKWSLHDLWDCTWGAAPFMGLPFRSEVKWSEVAQSCPTLCYPMDCSLPGSSVHGIFQARILEWVAISFSRGSSRPRDRTRVSHIVGRCFTIWATREAFQEWCWLKEREREVRVKSVGKLCGAQSSWRARERWSSRCWGVRVKTCCPGIWSIQVAHW